MPLSKRIDDVKKEFHSQTSRDDVEKKLEKKKGNYKNQILSIKSDLK